MSSGRIAQLEELTLAPAGGTGIRLERGQLGVENVNIDTGGSSTARGGGIYVDGGQLELVGVVFTASTAAYGGHLYVTGGGEVTGSDVEFSGGSASNGGAIYADDGSALLFTNVLASGPWASGDGGFAYLDGADFTATDLVLDTPPGGTPRGRLLRDRSRHAHPRCFHSLRR